jgi:hypothetical protein
MGGAMGPRAAPGSGIGAFKRGGPSHKEGSAYEEKHESKKEAKREGDVKKYAHGGPVIAGHKTHGMSGTMHKAEEGISKGHDGSRGSVRGAGLDPISSKTSNAKGRVGLHKKST